MITACLQADYPEYVTARVRGCSALLPEKKPHASTQEAHRTMEVGAMAAVAVTGALAGVGVEEQESDMRELPAQCPLLTSYGLLRTAHC